MDIVVGRVARTHGLRGEVVVNPESDFPEERFQPGQVFHVRHSPDAEIGGPRPDAPGEVTVEAVRFHKGRPLLALRGIETIEQAEALNGAELRIPESALTRLPAGMFYHHDLIGCAVSTAAGETIGTVMGVEGDGAHSRLVVRGRHGEIQVPLASEICVEIAPAARRIVIDPPEGLIELNATRAARTDG